MAAMVFDSAFHWLLTDFLQLTFHVLNVLFSPRLISFIFGLRFKPKNHECMAFR